MSASRFSFLLCHFPLIVHPTLTHSWAQLDELVVIDGYKTQAVSRLVRMDAHSRERILVAGVRVLVGGATVVRPGVGARRRCQMYATIYWCSQHICATLLPCLQRIVLLHPAHRHPPKASASHLLTLLLCNV